MPCITMSPPFFFQLDSIANLLTTRFTKLCRCVVFLSTYHSFYSRSLYPPSGPTSFSLLSSSTQVLLLLLLFPPSSVSALLNSCPAEIPIPFSVFLNSSIRFQHRKISGETGSFDSKLLWTSDAYMAVPARAPFKACGI